MKSSLLLLSIIALSVSNSSYCNEEDKPLELEDFQEKVGKCKILRHKPIASEMGTFDFAIYEETKAYRISQKRGIGYEKSVKVINRRGKPVRNVIYDYGVNGKSTKNTYFGSFDAFSKGMKKINQLCSSRS